MGTYVRLEEFSVNQPVQTFSQSQVKDLVKIAARAADEKKATNPVVLDVGDLLSITEAFLIASAPNTRLVRSIAEEVELAVKTASGLAPRRIEGMQDGSWVLMDYGDFVVHLFLEETRDFYDLERLWADAPKLDWAA